VGCRCLFHAAKDGKDRKGNQRFRCLTCRKTFSERPARPLGAMQLPLEKALLCLHLLCEGNAVRSIERIVGVDKKTILKLLVQVGEGCERMLSETIQAVPVEDVQADELWTFIQAKQGTCARRKVANPDAGDAYCYFGIERNSKLILAWHLGRRNG
jgi:transposase-like protein